MRVAFWRRPDAPPKLKGEEHQPDVIILIAVVALAAIGILMVYSSSAMKAYQQYDGDTFKIVGPQVVWALLGLVAMVVMMRIDYRWLRKVSVPAFGVALVLLVIVLIPQFGIRIGGSARWLQIGPLPALHPAEFAKLAMIIYLAHWFARRGGRVREFWSGTVTFLVIFTPVLALVLVEPDLGTSAVIGLTAVTMFFVAGANIFHLAAMASAGVAGVVLLVSRTPYQLDRVRALFDPWADPLGIGFHTIQGLLALGLGGVLGAGLGESRLAGGLFLPNASNDFIFAIIGEEFGLVGGGLVVILFLMIGYQGMRTALAAPDTFGALLAAGITTWICVQAFINIGVVVAILPITGITLPFISAGGSSLIISFAAVGILLSISRETVERGTWNDAAADRGGRDGGDIYPALAVARSLLDSSSPAPEIDWVGGHRGLETSLVRGAGFPIRRLALRSLRSVELSANTVLDPARLAISVPQATAMLLRRRPAAIFTTGGYVAIPLLLAAAALRIPTVLWEGNVIPGRSVRSVARLASAIAVSFAATRRTLGGRCYVTGTPIRDIREVSREDARARFDLGPTDRLMLIFGGSQAVRRFNAAVAEALPRLIERVSVIHVTGDAGYPGALGDRERLPVAVRDRYRPYPFLRDEMLAALAACDLVVGRGGSSTLAEVTALGLPMIVVPYPHAAGHQRANARVLVEAGGALLIDDEAFDADALLGAAAILEDPERHQRMADASRALGRPGAADAVAELVLAAAEGQALPDPARLERVARRPPHGSARVTPIGSGSSAAGRQTPAAIQAAADAANGIAAIGPAADAASAEFSSAEATAADPSSAEAAAANVPTADSSSADAHAATAADGPDVHGGDA